jgi:hypothetical protein
MEDRLPVESANPYQSPAHEAEGMPRPTRRIRAGFVLGGLQLGLFLVWSWSKWVILSGFTDYVDPIILEREWAAHAGHSQRPFVWIAVGCAMIGLALFACSAFVRGPAARIVGAVPAFFFGCWMYYILNSVPAVHAILTKCGMNNHGGSWFILATIVY